MCLMIDKHKISFTLCKDKAVAVVHNIKPLASDVNVSRVFGIAYFLSQRKISTFPEPLC